MMIRSESELAAVAHALAGPTSQLTPSELCLVRKVKPVASSLLRTVTALIAAGDDPLGDTFCQLRSAADRRTAGAVYTPSAIIESMLGWAAQQGRPSRIIDPGCGSGRFTLSAAKRFKDAALIAIDTDPLATLMLRANAAVWGIADRLSVHCSDYRTLSLPEIDGSTLFIGNPPYVRHHEISKDDKAWFAKTASSLGFKASKLAGLHIHFFLKTRQLARPGDVGAFITSSEWLDVNYGSVLRSLLADGLGGSDLHVLSAESMPFAAATTGAITCFRVGRRPDYLKVRAVDSLSDLGNLGDGKAVDWATVQQVKRWSLLIRSGDHPAAGHIEVGELFRVHRGQVTGANDVWIAGAYPGQLPTSVLFPTITSADELFAAGPVLNTASRLRRVIDLPPELETLSDAERRQVRVFLKWAKEQGAADGYVAQHRKAWWSVRLREPAPILCTYMARRPPAFVQNDAKARHINIAHGLYPRERLSASTLKRLVQFLRENVSVQSGRTYAGGLTKFEPKEIERLAIPHPDQLHELA